MVKLIGITEHVFLSHIGGQFKTEEQEEIVATFNTREQAERYVRAAGLKKEKREAFTGTVRYKANSVLRGCAYHEICEEEDNDVPHNPML
jgi:hypothetical protein